jgi:tetratricopeptide (TPR) repeat protein
MNAGEPIRDEDDYFGLPVVVAKRLCDKAGGGQILVSEVVRRLAGTRGGYSFRALGELRLKGLAEGSPAYEVGWRPSAEERMPLPSSLDVGKRTPFVGRERETALLHRHWELARTGESRLVLVEGEPGIGKTRIATELCLAAHAGGAVVLYGRCYEEASIPYQPIAEAVRHYIATCPLDQLRELVSKSAGELARIAPELERRLPDLPAPASADPESERYRFFEAVTSLFTNASQLAPLVLFFEDLHWADEPTLLLLRHISRSLGRSRALVLGAYRGVEVERGDPLAETLADLRRDDIVERVTLDGLEVTDVAKLIAGLVGRPAPADVARAIQSETEGNPFFVEEVLRHLRDSGVMTPDGELASAEILRTGLPDGVKDAVARRLGRLSVEANRALTIASVIGRNFDLELLERITGEPGDHLVEALEEALMAQLIRENPLCLGEYSFSHALTRDVLHDQISTTRRARLHRSVAEAIEEASGGSADDVGELAHHFFEAARLGDVDKAMRYSVQAAERASAQLAHEKAADHLERALEALAIKGRDEAQRCDLLLALGEARWRAGIFERARATFLEAARSAKALREPEKLARAALGYGGPFASFASGEVDEVLIDLLEQALAALGDEETALRSWVTGRLAEAVTFSANEERRAELSRSAVRMARDSGDRSTLAYALLHTQWATWSPDNLDERLATASEVVQLAAEGGQSALGLQARVWRLNHLLEGGDVDRADEEFEECIHLALEVRQPYNLWQVGTLRAMRALLEGHFEEAERLAADALAIGQEAQNLNAVQLFGVQLLALRREQGRFGELEEPLRAFAREYPTLPWGVGLALLLAEQGRMDDARAELMPIAADGFAGVRRNMFWLPAMALSIEACALLGERALCHRLYELLRPYEERYLILAPVVACYGSVARFLGLAATAAGLFEQAESHFEQALVANDRLRARPWIAHAHHDYARMLRARAAPGDEARARRMLDRAAATAEELGMQALLDRIGGARAVLGGVRSDVLPGLA